MVASLEPHLNFWSLTIFIQFLSLFPCTSSAYQFTVFPMEHRWMGPPRQCNLCLLRWVTWANCISFHGPSWCETILEQKHWIHPKRVEVTHTQFTAETLLPQEGKLCCLTVFSARMHSCWMHRATLKFQQRLDIYVYIYIHIYDISIYRLGWQVYAYGIYIYFFIFQIFKYTKYVKCGCWGRHNKSSNSWEKIKAPIPTVLHLIEPQAFTQTLLSLYTFILRFYLPLVYYESHP